MLRAARVRKWWPYLLLVIIGAALVACGGGGDNDTPMAGEATKAITSATATVEVPTPEEPPGEQALARMAIDAIAGDEVDESLTGTGEQFFEVDIVTEEAGPGYQGYQYWLEWDPGVLEYEGAEDFKPEELSLCATPSPARGVLYGGCVRVSGDTFFVGPLSRVTFKCVGKGTSSLHLKPIAEDPHFGTSLLTYRGAVVATALFDASVTCEGG